MGLQLQSLCNSSLSPKITLSPSGETVRNCKAPSIITLGPNSRTRLSSLSKLCIGSSLTCSVRETWMLKLKSASIVCASNSESGGVISEDCNDNSERKHDEVEPYRGKPGSLSFHGMTYQSLEESKLMSSPSTEGTGSAVWLFAPLAVILSFILPPVFLRGAVESVVTDSVLAELVTILSCEAVFYAGVAAFLFITDRALVPVAPLIVGYLAQFSLEKALDKRGSSCWPIVPIIFEVYRLYQLARGAQFVERLIIATRGVPGTRELMERSGALVGMLVMFQVVALVCLWSLLTFLLRLFPSRPQRKNC